MNDWYMCMISKLQSSTKAPAKLLGLTIFSHMLQQSSFKQSHHSWMNVSACSYLWDYPLAPVDVSIAHHGVNSLVHIFICRQPSWKAKYPLHFTDSSLTSIEQNWSHIITSGSFIEWKPNFSKILLLNFLFFNARMQMPEWDWNIPWHLWMQCFVQYIAGHFNKMHAFFLDLQKPTERSLQSFEGIFFSIIHTSWSSTCMFTQRNIFL